MTAQAMTFCGLGAVSVLSTKRESEPVLDGRIVIARDQKDGT